MRLQWCGREDVCGCDYGVAERMCAAMMIIWDVVVVRGCLTTVECGSPMGEGRVWKGEMVVDGGLKG